MSATEVSLDAPIDRSDRDASTLGERFAGVDGAEIEEVTDYKLMREFIDRVFRSTSRRANARSSISTTDWRKAPRR